MNIKNYTISENIFCKNYVMPLGFERNINLCEIFPKVDLYRLIILSRGNGSANINGKIISFTSPAFLCLNEKDEINIIESNKSVASVLFFKPEIINSKFSFNFINGKNMELSQTEFQDMFVLRQFIHPKSVQKKFIFLDINSHMKTSELMDKIIKEVTELSHPLWPCVTRSYVFELFNLLSLISENVLVKDIISTNENISRIIGYINSYYNENITIQKLTELFETNRTTLSSQFLQSTGISVMQYVKNYRLDMAAMFLRDTFLSVTDIAFRVGYNDSGYFSKTFSKEYAISPAAYRKKFSTMKKLLPYNELTFNK